MVTFGTISPVLRIFDEAQARDFYERFLGFTRDWEHRFEPGLPLYAQVSRGGLCLHLSGHHGDATPGATLFVPTADLDALHDELTTRGHPGARPGIEHVPWGREMTLTDPFGNRLRFTHQHSAPSREASS
ncbi:glyoxalase superfamily protein [Jannaschia sp. 2305UL9-9]|uniref:glyoxalase superfamily protein n=1 Tax=Jannaschia sp. 2305UL9-9 TaxID=3121638 RepID=UPI003528FA98